MNRVLAGHERKCLAALWTGSFRRLQDNHALSILGFPAGLIAGPRRKAGARRRSAPTLTPRTQGQAKHFCRAPHGRNWLAPPPWLGCVFEKITGPVPGDAIFWSQTVCPIRAANNGYPVAQSDWCGELTQMKCDGKKSTPPPPRRPAIIFDYDAPSIHGRPRPRGNGGPVYGAGSSDKGVCD